MYLSFYLPATHSHTDFLSNCLCIMSSFVSCGSTMIGGATNSISDVSLCYLYSTISRDICIGCDIIF